MLTRLVEVAEVRQAHLVVARTREVVQAEVETPRLAVEHQEDMAAPAAVVLAGHPEVQVAGLMGTRPGDHLGAHQVDRLGEIQAGLRAGLVAVAALTDQEV